MRLFKLRLINSRRNKSITSLLYKDPTLMKEAGNLMLEETDNNLEDEVEDTIIGCQNPNHSKQVVRNQNRNLTIPHACGQEGHIAVGCRVRLDHKKSLNFGLPNPGDKDLAERGNVPQTRMH